MDKHCWRKLMNQVNRNNRLEISNAWLSVLEIYVQWIRLPSFCYYTSLGAKPIRILFSLQLAIVRYFVSSIFSKINPETYLNLLQKSPYFNSPNWMRLICTTQNLEIYSKYCNSVYNLLIIIWCKYFYLVIQLITIRYSNWKYVS